jgi:hypothetical protein
MPALYALPPIMGQVTPKQRNRNKEKEMSDIL